MPFILYDSNYYNNSYMIFFENDIVAGNGVAKYFNVPSTASEPSPTPLKDSSVLIAEQTTTLDNVDTTYDGGSFEPTGY